MNMYELQAKCERIRDQAAKADSLEAALRRAGTRFAALVSALTVERTAHNDTARERDLYRAICVGLSRQLETERRARLSRAWWE